MERAAFLTLAAVAAAGAILAGAAAGEEAAFHGSCLPWQSSGDSQEACVDHLGVRVACNGAPERAQGTDSPEPGPAPSLPASSQIPWLLAGLLRVPRIPSRARRKKGRSGNADAAQTASEVLRCPSRFRQEAAVVCGGDGAVLEVTAAAESLLEIRSAEIVGRPVEDGLGAPELARAIERVLREEAPEEPILFRLPAPHLAGGCEIEASCLPLRREDGRVAGALLLLRGVHRAPSGGAGSLAGAQDFRALVESAALPAVVVRQGRIVYANPATAQHLEAPLVEILGAPMTEFIHPEDRNLVVERHLARLRGEQPPAHYFLRMRTRTGETKWVALDVAVVEWEGAPATFSFLRDVTALKEVQERLKESERRFRELMHAAEDAILLMAEDRILDGNEAAARMFGFASREEFLRTGATPASLSPPLQPDGRGSAEMAAEMIRLAFERGCHRFEWVCRRVSGEEFPVQVSLTPTIYQGRPVVYGVVRDIGEQKRLEEERQRKAQLLQEAERIAHIGSFDYDIVQGRIVWSDELFRIFEADPEHFVPNYAEFMVRVHPEDRAAVEHAYLQSLEGKAEDEIVHRIITLRGRTKYLHQRWKNYFDANGRPIRAIGVTQDVTEHKLAELAIQEAESRFFEVFYHSDDPCFLLSEFQITDCNQAAVRLFGYSSREELLAECRSILDISPPLQPDGSASEEEAREMIRGALECGHERRDWRCRRQDGGELEVRLSLTPIPMRGAMLLYGVARDVTAERAMQQRLRQLARAVEQCASIIVVTDRAGNIVYANPAFQKETGYGLPEVLGKNPRFLQSGQTPRETYQDLWRTICRGQVWRGEFCNRRKDGTFYWEAATIAPIFDEEENIAHFVAAKENITARKLAEQGLIEANRALAEAKARAEEASQAKSQFLASMSHEMRTPLNAIFGLTDLLLDGQHGLGHRRYLELIRSNARSLLALINDLLDLARIESGRLQLETLDFDLDTLIEELTAAMAVKARTRGLELVVDPDPGLPRRLRGDPVRLRQVLANLLDNAIKFTHEGEVELRVTAEPAPPAGGACLRRFTVRDTGIGIAADRLETIFEKFTQADLSISRRYGGTGLGLAICRQLVEMMGGRIGVSSEPGRGSEFWFTARFGLQPGAEEAEGEAAGPLRGRRVLVVEDNQTARRAVLRALQAWGGETEEADSGAAALERLRQAQERRAGFDVALIDVRLPDSEAPELARQLSQQAGPARLQAVLLAPPGEEQPPEEEAVAGRVLKPVCPRRLREALLQALTGTEARSPAKPATAAESARSDAAIRPSARVLVAEDTAVNRMVLRAMLRKLDVEAEMAVDGHAALEALARSEFDLVLMDVQMPELDGLKAVRRLRALEQTGQCPEQGRRLPVIALTAHAMPEDRRKCLEAGMDDYLSKPVSLAALGEMLDKWLPGRKNGGGAQRRSDGCGHAGRADSAAARGISDHPGAARPTGGR